ncbi:PQQ-binding-like beta-propeller repeat protein [Cellulosimicrobium cellulans]|uniref:outer membrane protein assembly factor BamB family protein n=1 Tax=Cellulosimicrobium cellulans TaxID=1710 RepID=UPI001BA7D974|nr:PQQ-binding-like beta-propeller repeat protein [Cellulosimicrobium cellulans]QUC00351.1 PQQ-binding-like beta-propeller repeat protein [Cellulosimicrobium cellulans]
MRRRRLAQDRAARAGHVTHEPTTDGAGTAVGGFELLPPELRSDDRFDAALDAALAGPAEAPVRRPPDGPRPRDEDGPPAVRGGHHDRAARDVLPLSRPQDEPPSTAHDTPGLARSGAPRPSRSAGVGEAQVRAAGRRWFLHPVPWVALAVAVAFAGSVAFTASMEDARPVDVTALAGGLRPLEDPPEPRWSVPVEPGTEVVPAVGAVVTVDGSLTAYSVADGSVLWRSARLGDRATCLPASGEPAREVVVCAVPTGWREQAARLTTVRATTGEVVGERTAATAGRLSVVPVGATDVVRAWWRGDEVAVVREDAATGEVQWERTLAHDGLGSGGDVVLDVRRGVVDVLAPGVAAALTEDGLSLVEDDVWTIVRLQDGRYVGNEYGRGTATVFTAAGEPAFRISGRVLEAPLSDGSAPGVIVTNTFGSIVGVDAATGSELWSLPGTGMRAVARVDGRVVVQTDSAYRSVDARTGEEEWAVTLEDGGPGPVLTDGRSLFVTERQRRQPGLVSIALDDGAVEWRWTLPEGTYDVLAVEGRLFLLGTGGLTAVS